MVNKVSKSALFISIFCVLFIGILAVLANILWIETKRFSHDAISQQFDVLHQNFQSEINHVILDARSIAIQESKSSLIVDSLVEGDAKRYLTAHWSALFDAYPSLQQIRYIALDGNEQLRAEKSAESLIWRDTKDLQNKADRYYFIEAVESPKDYYISPLDLNKERGIIELPYRPTIRSVAKYRVDGEVLGLVVLNFDLRELFSRLKALQSTSAHWLINPDGFFLSSPNNSAWGWLLDRPKNQVSMQFPGFEKRFNGSEDDTPDGNFTSRFKHGIIPIGKRNTDDTDIEDAYYWLVMEKPTEAVAYLERTKHFFIFGFVAAALFLIGLAYLLIRLLNQLSLEKELAIKAKNKANNAEKSKADFLARMSHEIRTPMNGVYGLLQITLGERNYKKINDNIEQAITSFSLLSRIIDDVLDFSKIEAGKLDMVEAPFRLDSLLNQVGKMMGRAAYGKHIELWIDVDPKCPKHVVGDAVRLNQIISNLISNAIKFTSRGEVNLSVELLGENEDTVQLGFEVQDTGIGMTEKQANQIFGAFTQASRDTNTKFGGTGLGLSIAKQLVEMMHGKIGVVSQQGKGSKFHFNVLLKKASAAQAESLSEQDVVSYQAIVLTQNVNVETGIQRQCSVLGWPSYVAKSVEDLMSHKSSNSLPRVIIIDEAILSVISKEALADWQQEQKEITHLVVVSHNTESFDKNSLVLFDDLLYKPFTPSTLYDTVISCNQSTDELAQKPVVEDDEKLLAKRLVLVVEDNPINQQVAGAMLKSAGAIVKFAENGQECLDLLLSGFKPHLILMDMQMPIMGGVEAAEHIRANATWDNIPILAMTANAMEADRKRCIDAGMQGHIVKPVVKQDLITQVKLRLTDN
ncbi:hybrid sensor histidine kinase/response regulator [Alteromonas stellipolaris]|uniref:hybrid sensor histidine kinase/response regulator n=1 Tax=Alteromonas stellipolaris TaxID=233316 RepID=UPI002735ADFB|nr:hybrid sensor histidine kinase/response regulator [Alteromonas stellipolaris]MDP2535470.1 ATP-binding protein [Alteromonas stellipolaris]